MLIEHSRAQDGAALQVARPTNFEQTTAQNDQRTPDPSSTCSVHLENLKEFLDPAAPITVDNGIPAAAFLKDTPGLRANAYYFGQPKWLQNWFDCVHRYPQLGERWRAVAGSWDDRIVVDVGCGPGNLFVEVGGRPKALLGIDVARGSLQWAAQIGYTPLLADAHAMPLRSGFADLVAINSTLHHCDDMEAVLAESARLVRPGGMLVTDHDPQRSAGDLKYLGKVLWNLRMPIYRVLDRGGHSSADDEQAWAFATEIHHKPGDGVTTETFRRVLEPLGFEVQIWPHNIVVGAELLGGQRGRAPFKVRVAQILSGIRPDTAAAAMTLLCVARRRA